MVDKEKSFSSEKFKEASETGVKVLILKAIGKCDCYDEEDLSNSEPDPTCQKCYGTGLKRIRVTSEKIRFNSKSESASKTSMENGGLLKGTRETYVFYFSSKYGFLSNKDYICLFEEDAENSKVNRVFEIKNKAHLIYENFSYYEVYGTKVDYFGMVGEITEPK